MQNKYPNRKFLSRGFRDAENPACTPFVAIFAGQYDALACLYRDAAVPAEFPVAARHNAFDQPFGGSALPA
jgi:hypothetical protein